MSGPQARIRVRIQPRAARNEIVGERGGAVVVRVTAPPAGGLANDALRRLIAKRAGVGGRSVTITRGARSRDKVVVVDGLEIGSLRRALGL